MKEIFREYLFRKHILVSQKDKGIALADIMSNSEKLCLLVSLSGKFGIRITEGAEMVTEQILLDAAHNLGEYIPEPFYRGFPNSVRELTPDQKLFDQLLHYSESYGIGWFDSVGHSALEEILERLKFSERTEPKEFRILSEENATHELLTSARNLLSGSRPLNVDDWMFVQEAYVSFGGDIFPESGKIPCKNTVVRLLYFSKNPYQFITYMKLPDVIKLLEYIEYEKYGNEDLTKLNLCNQDRKLITKTLDTYFAGKPIKTKYITDSSSCDDDWSNDMMECYEKRKIWKGLLHHIHYDPKNPIAQSFVRCIRVGKNRSAYSYFEKWMMKSMPTDAAMSLCVDKGSGAVLRNLNYILSRCENRTEVEYVISILREDADPAIMISLLHEYAQNHDKNSARTFLFAKNNRMRVHTETDEEVRKRRSHVSHDIREEAKGCIWELLKHRFNGTFYGKKVYIDSAMHNIAVPIQTSTGSSGFDVLPTGSKVSIPEGKKIRAFTYWEKVNDIDLSCFGLSEDGDVKEFSWRSMYEVDAKETGVVFSGDQTSGYNGGSEYFDIDLDTFKEKYPEYRYIVFCDNVYTDGGSIHFNDCFAKAGYMMRDKEDSGEVFEPKTVKSSFRLTTDTSFNYMFALDMKDREIIWLNIGRQGNHAIAGESGVDLVRKWLNSTKVISMFDILSMCGGLVYNYPDEADIVVTTDDSYVPKKNQEVIRPYDIEKMQKILTGWT